MVELRGRMRDKASFFFFFSSRRRHTRLQGDWSSDVCSSDLRSFNGVARSDAVVVVEITMRRGRSDAMKKALYAAIARNLHEGAGVAPADVFIFMHENDYSDWSVGHGRFAMALVQQTGAQ